MACEVNCSNIRSRGVIDEVSPMASMLVGKPNHNCFLKWYLLFLEQRLYMDVCSMKVDLCI